MFQRRGHSGQMNIPNKTATIVWLKQNPFVPLILAIGALLLLLPTNTDSEAPTVPIENEISAPTFSVESEETRLEGILGNITGVGKVNVLLSLKNTATRSIISSLDEAIIISSGSGKEEVVDKGYEYPSYLGAIVVCEGGNNANLKLEITSAVSAYTGLSMSKIIILEMS